MAEATINPKALEDAMLKALPTLFPNLLGTTSNPGAEFYDKFLRAADDHDRGFVKKYDEDLNSTLVFAGLFSAVTSAFIIDVQNDLEPDFEQMNHTLLKIVASAALGNTPTGADAALPEWKGPDSTVVHILAVLYSSLAASLLSAFFAMLGKQWLNRYASVERGSIIDRGRDRKRKMEGMVTWQFGLVMECLPLMLQAALLLLGYALSHHLFFINKVVGSVVIGFSTFGLLFYFLIVSAATISYNCPFQTPLPLTLRFLVRFDSEHKKYLKRSRRWIKHTFSQVKQRLLRPKFSYPHGLGELDSSDRDSVGIHIELPVVRPSDQPPSYQLPPLFKRKIDWEGYVLDSNCIAWMFEMSMDMDVATAISGYIPEIVWYSDTCPIPLGRLYDTVLKCFDHSSGHPVLKLAFRDAAFLGVKALLHLSIQRLCLTGSIPYIESITSREQIFDTGCYRGDSDLESTLGFLSCLHDGGEPLYWEEFSFTIPHHAWLGHILLYHTWSIHRRRMHFPDHIQDFVLYSLRLEPPPPAPIIADCLFIIGLVLGIRLHVNDLSVVDKSDEISPQIARIYEKLTEVFTNPAPTTDDIKDALLAMRLIAPLSKSSVSPLSEDSITILSEGRIGQKSYDLFHIIMQTPISSTYCQGDHLEASHLAMHGAYKWGGPLPWVEDPHNILTFLNQHFGSIANSTQNQHAWVPYWRKRIENQDEPIQNALYALASASGPVAIEALKDFNPVEPLFVDGIYYAFQVDQPLQLRRAAFLFLPLISDNWFNSPDTIRDPGLMGSFCVGWASVVDAIEHTHDIQKAALIVFLGMINSPHWHPHIVVEKWRLLEYSTSVPDDSQALRRCICNPKLMDEIRNLEDPVVLTLWLTTLWLRHKMLVPQIQEQLETVTKEVAQGERKTDLDQCFQTMESELGRVKDELAQLEKTNNRWTRDNANLATALKAKIKDLQEARVSFIALSS